MALLHALLLGAILEVPRESVELRASGLRVLVLERNDHDPAEWAAVRGAGANVAALFHGPTPESDELATAAGLDYLAFLTTDEIGTLSRDASWIAQTRAQRSLVGFYFWDAQAIEGFTTPEAQAQAYSTLKALFPDKLVLYPTRLDPIVWSESFRKRFFRPEFTDLVTPYFYPVGTTIIGEAHEDSEWRLAELLALFAPYVPPGKGLLPVLQGFEQKGYPVTAALLPRQLAIYRRLWPDLSNAAIYAWRFGTPEDGPLVEIAGRPDLEEGLCRFLGSISRTAGCRSRAIPSFR